MVKLFKKGRATTIIASIALILSVLHTTEHVVAADSTSVTVPSVTPKVPRIMIDYSDCVRVHSAVRLIGNRNGAWRNGGVNECPTNKVVVRQQMASLVTRTRSPAGSGKKWPYDFSYFYYITCCSLKNVP